MKMKTNKFAKLLRLSNPHTAAILLPLVTTGRCYFRVASNCGRISEVIIVLDGHSLALCPSGRIEFADVQLCKSWTYGVYNKTRRVLHKLYHAAKLDGYHPPIRGN